MAAITGASRGIGRAIALSLAAEGFDLALSYRSNSEAAVAVARSAEELGASVVLLAGDVASGDYAKRLAAAVYERWDRIDLVVNNAGIVRDRPLILMTEEEWHEVISTNVNGTFNISRAFVYQFVRQRAGRIINVSSVAGLVGVAGQTNYCASKAAIIGFSRALAKELGPYGVSVNCIAPGFIETDMIGELPDKRHKENQQKIPAGRYGTTEEVARLVTFLATAPDYITGQIYGIDGGLTC